MEVKEKFLPITQYIKPEVLRHIKEKKENKKMRKLLTSTCPDCGEKGVEITSQGICVKCRQRKTNAKANGKEYVPYVKLSKTEQEKIDTMRRAQDKKKAELSKIPSIQIPAPSFDYYKAKAEQKPVPQIALPVAKPQPILDPLSDEKSFVTILKECGCEIPDVKLKEILDVLTATDKLKDSLLTIAKSENQDALLDLEQMLNVAERKLQHNWEYNGFQDVDDIKFKGFLTWRRALKGSIYFWKALYSTNTLIELQKAWSAYVADPTKKVTLSRDRTSSIQKRYQITTETTSTIFNTRRPFTRVFYATSQDEAYETMVKWLSDRQLHEDKSKTKIVELTSEGVDGRKESNK